jgi:hypothetical protein
MSETYQSKQERRQRLPRAIEQLRADADTSFADLLDPPSQPLTATFLQTIVDKEI